MACLDSVRVSGSCEGIDGMAAYCAACMRVLGGCLTGILVSAFEDPSRLPGLKLPANQGALRFAVNVAGFRSRDAALQGVYLEQGIKTPLLHVLGR